MQTPVILFVTTIPLVDRFWITLLKTQKYHTQVLTTLSDISSYLQQQTVDLVIIRIKNGDKNDLKTFSNLCRTIDVPVVLLLDTHDEAQLVNYYQAGINDYLLEPINPDLLLAKVQVWLGQNITKVVVDHYKLEARQFELDATRRVVKLNGKPVKLTQLEYRLLTVLLTNARQIFDAQVLIHEVWGYDNHQDPALLKQLVYRLRQKIEPDPHQPRHILFIPGQGYCFQPVPDTTPQEVISKS